MLGHKATYFVGLLGPGALHFTPREARDAFCTAFRSIHGADPEGYTCQNSEGFWKGQAEPSIVLTYFGLDNANVATVEHRRVAAALARLLRQEAVLLDVTASDALCVEPA